MDYKQIVQEKIDDLMPELVALSDEIWRNPEYNFQEHKACAAFSSLLKKLGFEVETGVGGLETAVRATYSSNKEGPHIGFLGEYDAVPGMGHSCGHNLMAAMAVGSGAAIRSIIDEMGGTVTVFGTPAEEGGGGKVIMLENGAFDALDVAMILHPANETVVNDISYSKTDVLVDFYGVKSHAATWPEEGVSALTPILELFNLINAMRLEIADRGKILGVITKGGEEPIFIPDHCQAKFTVRSFNGDYKWKLFNSLIKTCESLAEITGTRFEYRVEGPSYEDIRNNPILEELLQRNFDSLGELVMPRRKELGIGCTDMGNVTHKVPGFQSYIQVVPELRGHTPEFEDAVGGPYGQRAINIGAKSMAMTAVDVLMDKNTREKIMRSFNDMKAHFGWEG
ncbi:M20 family metallopeptidase [Acidaminobacter hydrogenoformans]|uniref:Peptidase M20 domain-containing protein 2 n=1 Tax=Acidaminobacter hydrogenoformans DSM 2784 TaxID=1120920 RepID=A0A1G5S453_9FIRM|nr:M20 family metallopeptidase [Acidaminobacter hydrogenoformans]SCZ81103.1 amidohydrolase [Acidaminobacter hydrogenoformans DSM 2784]